MKVNIKTIFVLALIARIVFILTLGTKVTLKNDAAGYDSIAVNLVEHSQYAFEKGVPTVRRSPVYPLFLAGVYSVFGHSLPAVRIIQALISALTCVLVYLIALKIFNEKTALLAAAITGIYPFFIYYTVFHITETLFTFLLVLWVYYMVLCSENAGTKNCLAAGAAAGLASLCRPTAYPLIALFLLFFFFEQNKKPIKSIFVMLIAAAVLIIPWGMRNKRVFDSFCITHIGGMGNLFASLLVAKKTSEGLTVSETFKEESWLKGDSLHESSRGYYYLNEFKKLVTDNPIIFVKNAVRKFCRMWRPYPILSKINVAWLPSNFVILAGFLFYDVIILLAFAGLYYHKFTIKSVYLLLPVISFSFVHMVFSSTPRFRRPVMPFVIILSAVGFLELLKKYGRTKA